MGMRKKLSSGFLCSVFLVPLLYSPAHATTSAGLDTPSGVDSLPLAVSGQTAITLTANDPKAQTPSTAGVNIQMPVTEGSTTIGTDGSMAVGSNLTTQPAAVLTVNGNATVASTTTTVNGVPTTTGGDVNAVNVTVLGTAVSGADCSAFAVGTIAQDGTGKLLSCQSITSGKTTTQMWQAAQGSLPGRWEYLSPVNGYWEAFDTATGDVWIATTRAANPWVINYTGPSHSNPQPNGRYVYNPGGSDQWEAFDTATGDMWIATTGGANPTWAITFPGPSGP